MQTKKLRAKDLIIDPRLKEIRHINQVYVSRYRQNYRNGANFPPLIVDENTNIVVSGNHRLTAIIKEYGEDELVTVQLRKFNTEKARLKEFIKQNSTHGMPLDQFTKKKFILAYLEKGGTREEIASILNVPVKKIDDLGDGVLSVETGNGKTELKPKKRGLEPPVNKKITEEQYRQHDGLDRGIPLKAQINQLLRWLRDDLIILNKKNYEALVELRDKIDNYIQRHGKNKAS